MKIFTYDLDKLKFLLVMKIWLA